MRTQISIDNQPGIAYDFARHRRVGRSSFLIGYRHLFGILLVLALVLTQGIFSPWAHADSFPGHGNRQTWLQANDQFNLGNALTNQGDNGGAITKYREAIRLYPWDSNYYLGLSVAQSHSGDLRAAEASVREAIRLKQDWKYWNNLARILYAQKRYSESKAAALKALDLNPPLAEKEGINKAIKVVNEKLKSVAEHQP